LFAFVVEELAAVIKEWAIQYHEFLRKKFEINSDLEKVTDRPLV
jgi:hypothetical protein